MGVIKFLPTLLTAAGGYSNPVSFTVIPDQTDGDPDANQKFLDDLDVIPQDVNGNELASPTPTATGTPVSFQFNYKQGVFPSSNRQQPGAAGLYAGGLLGCLLLGMRRKKVVRLVCALVALVCISGSLSGCDLNTNAMPATIPVIITAIPNNGQGATQKITVNVTFYQYKRLF